MAEGTTSAVACTPYLQTYASPEGLGMVDLSGQNIHGWTRRETGFRPIAIAVCVVATTGIVAAIAWRALAHDLTSITTLWVMLGTVAVWSLARRIVSSFQTKAARASVPLPAIHRNGAVFQAEARRHRRFVPARRSTTLHLRNGRCIAARIVDISIAGVAVDARMSDMDFMAVVRVGARDAGPIRRTPQGAVFGFEVLLDPQPFDASFVL